MTEESAFRALHGKQLLVSPMSASSDDRRAFLGVYPIDRSWPSTIDSFRRLGISMPPPEAGPIYQVSTFEINHVLVESQDYPSEEDLHRVVDVIAIGDDDLRVKLKEVGIGLEQLVYPSECDYPL